MTKLYAYKDLDFGFIILAADNDHTRVKNTHLSLTKAYTRPVIAAVSEDMHPEDISVLRKSCPVFQGRKTITSLINAGMRSAPAEWNILVIGGSYVRPNLDKKFSFFIEKTTDILFPIAEGKYQFIEGTINGLCIHRDTYKRVGNMSDQNPLEICKMIWALQAIGHGCTFKAISGTKIC